MKKIALLIVLGVYYANAIAQTIIGPPSMLVWRSDLGGASGSMCSSCPTFATLCVNETGPCTKGEWYKIGSPNVVSPGMIQMVSTDNTTEGLYTNFFFKHGHTYHFHMGVNSVTHPYSVTSAVTTNLAMYSANLLSSDFQYTCDIAYGECQDVFLQDFSSPGVVAKSPRWTTDPITGLPVPVTLDAIGSLTIGATGSTVDFATSYIPSTDWNQFAFHPITTTASPIAPGTPSSTVMDYVEIDVPCDASFVNYYVTPGSGSDMTFIPNLYFTTATYNWTITNSHGLSIGGTGDPTSGVWNTGISSGVYTISMVVTDLYGHHCAVSKNVTLNATTGGCSGCKMVSGINESSETEINNLNVYPNPASNLTSIQFNLNKPTNVSVELFDITGKKVLSLPSKLLNIGDQKMELNSSTLPTGVYSIKVITPNAILTKELSIVR